MNYLEFTKLPPEEKKKILHNILEKANKLQREAVKELEQ